MNLKYAPFCAKFIRNIVTTRFCNTHGTYLPQSAGHSSPHGCPHQRLRQSRLSGVQAQRRSMQTLHRRACQCRKENDAPK